MFTVTDWDPLQKVHITVMSFSWMLHTLTTFIDVAQQPILARALSTQNTRQIRKEQSSISITNNAAVGECEAHIKHNGRYTVCYLRHKYNNPTH